MSALCGEHGVSPFKEGGDFRICLVYPNSAAVALCNLGFAALFSILNRVNGCTAERAFAAGAGKTAGPVGESVETGRPMKDFAALAFTFMSELDYLNALAFLRDSGIPWKRSERGDADPLVIVGGAAPSLNPAPLLSMADIIIRGEAEDFAPSFFTEMAAAWAKGGAFAVKEAAAGYRGVVNSMGCLLFQAGAAENPAARLHLVNRQSVFSGMALIEATRGCPFSCRFCSARVLYRPFRVVPAEEITAYADRMSAFTKRIGLVGAGLSARSDLAELLDKLGSMGMKAACSSLRIDKMGDNLLESIRKHGQRTLTVAPESFHAPTLALLGKKAPAEDPVVLLRRLAARGFTSLKLYMMMGIPENNIEADVEAAVEVLSALGTRARRISLSYSIFQPKPGTPMASAPLAGPGRIKHEIRVIRRGLARLVGRLEIPGYRSALNAWILGSGGPEAVELALAPYRSRVRLAAATVREGRPWWLR